MIAFGDSHTRMFTPFVTDSCVVGGASAYGLANPKSVTNARNIFTEFLSNHPNDVVISCLGEVDCNATVWRRRDLTPSEYVDVAIAKYQRFLSAFTNKFILSSVVFPIVRSYQSKEYMARKVKPRAHVKVDGDIRALVVQLFNESLRALSDIHGHYFLNITSQTLNKYGRVRTKFVKRPDDSHLNRFEMLPIIKRSLDGAKSFCYNI